MLHYATEKVSMHLIGRICSIRRFEFSSIIVEQGGVFLFCFHSKIFKRGVINLKRSNRHSHSASKIRMKQKPR